MAGHAYILASQRNGMLYIGVTGDVSRRVGRLRDWEQGRRLPDAAGIALITVF